MNNATPSTHLPAAPPGVMSAGYALKRACNPALRFRLRSRAGVVVSAVKKYAAPASGGAQRGAPAQAATGGESNPGFRLLEVGAADGRTLLELHRGLGAGEFIGVEYDPGLMAAQPGLPKGVQLIRGDALELPASLIDEYFDVVSMLALLEHVNDPIRALREARRVLRPRGLLVATCPNPFWDQVAGKLGLVTDAYHVGQIDLARLKRLVAEAGFEVLAARRFMWAPIASLPYLRIPVSATAASFIDRMADALPVFRSLCVNAFVIGRKCD